MDNQIFRKVSVERLSSPEQLDSLMKVTSAKGWLALIALVFLIIVAIIWGVNGSLATKIDGQGVLIKPGGIHKIYTSSNGQITDIGIVIDDFVEKGDVIARIAQPDMIKQMEELKNEIASLENVLQGGNNATAQNQLTDLKSQLSQLKMDYEVASKVVSPYDGRVLEIAARKGDHMTEGTPLIDIEVTGDDKKELVALMYVPVTEGQKVTSGMDVQISPASVNKEEYGFMRGKVVSVSEFPISRNNMLINLGNEALANQLSGEGAFLEVRIDLTPNVSSESGYQWSSKQDPPVSIHSGTLARISIVLKEERPITSVIPQIK